MKLNEAQKIVKTIVNWHFVCDGIIERGELEDIIDLSGYSLADLLVANKLVEANNKRKLSLHKHYSNKNGKSKGICLQLTVSDRLIAAVYTAMNYPHNGEIIALMDDIGVGCVSVNYTDEKEVISE